MLLLEAEHTITNRPDMEGAGRFILRHIYLNPTEFSTSFIVTQFNMTSSCYTVFFFEESILTHFRLANYAIVCA